MFNGLIPARSRPQSDTTVYTDASLEAGAANHNSDFAYAAWECDFPGLKSEHIIVKELCAVWIALRRWSFPWTNKHIFLYTDNKGTEWCLRRGLTKNKVANDILREILWISALYNITFEVQYIETKANYIADAISRLHDDRFFAQANKCLSDQGIRIASPEFNFLKHMSYGSFQYMINYRV